MTAVASDTRLHRVVDWALGDDVLAGPDVGQAVLVVTDTLAAILGAAAEPEVAGFAEAAPHLGGPGAATVLATGARTSPYAAALANGQAAVRLELDEGNQFAANHPSAHTGVTAASGVLAVELAVTGTTADPRALHTVYGEVLGDAFDDRALDDGLGELRYLTRNYVKLHACSRWNHAPIEALAALVGEHGIGADDVESVEVATYDPATRLDGTAPTSGFGGKHSIPYSVAVRLLLGHNGIAAYTDDVAADPAMRDLMARVRVVEDPDLTRLAPAVRAARVTVRLRDGRTLTAQEDRAPGGFDHPYDAVTLRAKHEELLGPVAADVLGWCDALPGAASVRGLDRLVGRRS
jgi:2-methylcitrate dehydratase PrpD